MSVNNDTSIPIENPFYDRDSLKNAGLNKNETAVLSNCNYRNFAEKWGNSLGNISPNAHEHIVNGRKVEEGFLRRIGTWTGFISYEPWKEAEQIFSDWKSFNSYVRFKIPPETYQKIAKANPQYFDKVIEHLNSVADELDKRADVRIGTFVQNQSGQTLTVLAEDFRSTANFLKLKMHGDDAAKPENNNAKPEADRGQPTIINHYHNNIGHIGDINIGHLGDNNFHNKNGNMGVMFKESSNGVPHTGFRPERPALESPNSYYSPIINGKRFLDLTSEQVVQFALEGNKDKGKKLDVKHNEKLTFEAQKPLSKKNPENIKQQVDSINLGSENQQVYKTERDSKIYKKEELEDPQLLQEEEKTKKLDAVEQKKYTAKNIESRLRVLLGKYFAFWDKIHNDEEKDSKSLSDLIEGIDEREMNTRGKALLETEITSLQEKGITAEQEDKIFEYLNNIKDPVLKLKILGHVIGRLGSKLSEKNQPGIDSEYTNTIGSILNNIASIISDKDKETYNKKHGVLEKSNSEIVDHKKHDMVLKGNLYTPTEDEKKMSSNDICNTLCNETKKILKEIREYTFQSSKLGLEPKKITNPPTKNHHQNISPM